LSEYRARPLIILAGNAEQARSYAERAGLHRRSYSILSANTVRGMLYPDVILVGTYRERPDFQEIRQALIPCRPRCRDEEGKWASLKGSAPKRTRQTSW